MLYININKMFRSNDGVGPFSPDVILTVTWRLSSVSSVACRQSQVGCMRCSCDDHFELCCCVRGTCQQSKFAARKRTEKVLIQYIMAFAVHCRLPANCRFVNSWTDKNSRRTGCDCTENFQKPGGRYPVRQISFRRNWS